MKKKSVKSLSFTYYSCLVISLIASVFFTTITSYQVVDIKRTLLDKMVDNQIKLIGVLNEESYMNASYSLSPMDITHAYNDIRFEQTETLILVNKSADQPILTLSTIPSEPINLRLNNTSNSDSKTSSNLINSIPRQVTVRGHDYTLTGQQNSSVADNFYSLPLIYSALFTLSFILIITLIPRLINKEGALSSYYVGFHMGLCLLLIIIIGGINYINLNKTANQIYQSYLSQSAYQYSNVMELAIPNLPKNQQQKVTKSIMAKLGHDSATEPLLSTVLKESANNSSLEDDLFLSKNKKIIQAIDDDDALTFAIYEPVSNTLITFFGKKHSVEITELKYFFVLIVIYFLLFSGVVYHMVLKQSLPIKPYIFKQKKVFFISNIIFISWVFILSTAILVLDLTLPKTTSTGLPYVLVIISAWYLNKPRYIIPLAVYVSALLIVVSFITIQTQEQIVPIIVNRFVELLIIWLFTLVLLHVIKEKNTTKTSFRELKNIVDNIADAVIITDKDGTIIEFTKSSERVFGYSAKKVIGKPINDVILGRKIDSTLKCEKNINSDFFTLYSQKELIKGEHESGDLIHLTIKANEFTMQNVEYFCVICRNMSKQVEANQDVIESEKRLASAQRLAAIGSWTWYVKKDLLLWSKEMYRLWGVPNAEPATYDTFFSRLHPDDQDLVQEKVNNALKIGTFSVEYRVVADDGVTRYIYAEGEVTFDEENHPEVFLGTSQDITERKLQQLKIEEYQVKLQNLLDEKTTELQLSNEENIAKSRFLANMSHEFRTPMHGIIATLDLLENTEINSKQSHMVRIAKTSADNFLIIVNEILDYSKMSANEVELEILPFDIHQLMVEISEMFSASIRSKNILLVMSIDPNIPHIFMSSAFKIKQIMVNLIGNAIKFTDAKSSEDSLIEVKVNWHDNQLNIEVKDNGIGIEKNKIDNLFKPFTQADTSTTREYGGTGLGLPIAKAIIDLLGGTLVCNSERYVGTSFAMTMPMPAKPNTTEDHFVQNISVALIGFTGSRQDDLNRELSFYGAKKTIFENVEQYFLAKKQHVDYVVVSSDGHCPFSLLNQCPVIWLNFNSEYDVIDTPKNFHWIQANPFIASDVASNLQLIMQGKTVSKIIEHKPITPTQINNSHLKKTRIIVVEDNVHNRDVIQFQLDMLGYNCTIVSDGEIALNHMKKQVFDLVITDCHMPNIDGYQLTEMIRSGKHNINKDTLIIGLTGDLSEESIVRCNLCGMDDIIAKPAVLETINDSLIKVLSLAPNKKDEITQGTPKIIEDYLMKERLDDSVAMAYLSDDKCVVHKFRLSYLEKNKVVMEELMGFLDEPNIKKIGSVAHKLKSSSLYIGAIRMNFLCENVELLSKQDGHNIYQNIEILVKNMVVEFEALGFEINEYKP